MPTSLGAQGPTARLRSWPSRRIKAAVLFGILLASALAASFAFFYFTAPSPDWTSTIVDSSIGGVSAAVGPAGELVVSYSSGKATVATLAGGVWRTAYTGQEQNALSTAISVDSSGAFHLAYTYDPANHSANPSIRAVTNRGGTLTQIAFGPDSNLPSIAVSSNGTGHIAFFLGRYSISDLGIGYRPDAPGVGEAIRIVRTEPWNRKAIGIAVGPSDEVYIGAALDPVAGGVGYFTNETTGWKFHQVENVSVPDGGLAMAIDASGSIHMAYALPRSQDSPAVRYATNRGGSWSLVTIPGIGSETPGGAVAYLSMALDRAGHVHLIGIGSRSSDGCTSAGCSSAIVHSTDAGGSWATSTVTKVHLVELAGAPISLAITSDGHLHVLHASGGPSDSSLIDTVNVPGTVSIADVLQRWGATSIWILVAGGAGLLAVWLTTRLSKYKVFLDRKRREGKAKYQKLKALRREPP